MNIRLSFLLLGCLVTWTIYGNWVVQSQDMETPSTSISAILLLDSANSLTLFVAGNREFSLQGLYFEVTSRGETRRRYLEQYRSFEQLDFRTLDAPICLRLMRRDAAVGFPEQCQFDVPFQNLHTHLVEVSDVFWFDTISQQIVALSVVIGTDEIAVCPANQFRCEIKIPQLSEEISLHRVEVQASRLVLQPGESTRIDAIVTPEVAGAVFEWSVDGRKTQISLQNHSALLFTAPNVPRTSIVSVKVFDGNGVEIGSDSVPIRSDLRRVLADVDFSMYTDQSIGCRALYRGMNRDWHIQLGCFDAAQHSFINQSFHDFELELTAQKTDGSDRAWYGVVITEGFGTTSRTDHRFLISGLGTYTYEVASENSTKLDLIYPAELTPAINRRSGTNAFRIVRKGAFIEFWVNDVLLFSGETGIPPESIVSIGLSVVPHSSSPDDGEEFVDVRFGELVVFELGTE